MEEHGPRRTSWIEELNSAIEDIEKNKALLVSTKLYIVRQVFSVVEMN